MKFAVRTPGIVEVRYGSTDEMDPGLQPKLVAAIERELETASTVGVLFLVATASVPRDVPEFWLGVTSRLAPRLRAMAIVSENLAVRAAASGFGVVNHLRGVPLHVKAFRGAAEAEAVAWLEARRRE